MEFVTLCILGAFVDYRRRVFCAKFQQSYKQYWHLLALGNPASVGQQVLAVAFLTSVDSLLCPTSIFYCLLLLTVSFSGQLSQADWSLLPYSVNWLSLSFLRPSFPPPLLVSPEISSTVLCVDLAPKQTKRSSEWCQHKRKRIATQCVTHCIKYISPLYSSISLCILNFHLRFLKLFY